MTDSHSRPDARPGAGPRPDPGRHDPHPHPSPRQYVQIAILLAVITAFEVALFYLDRSIDLRGWDAPMLIVLSFMKFVIVIGWYMHLRFEKSTLSRFFTAGFVLALSLYGVVLGTFSVLVLTR